MLEVSLAVRIDKKNTLFLNDEYFDREADVDEFSYAVGSVVKDDFIALGRQPDARDGCAPEPLDDFLTRLGRSACCS